MSACCRLVAPLDELLGQVVPTALEYDESPSVESVETELFTNGPVAVVVLLQLLDTKRRPALAPLLAELDDPLSTGFRFGSSEAAEVVPGDGDVPRLDVQCGRIGNGSHDATSFILGSDAIENTIYATKSKICLKTRHIYG